MLVEKVFPGTEKRFSEGKQRFSNYKFAEVVEEEVDIHLMRGRSWNSHGRGKHRSLVKGAYTLNNYRNGSWSY